MYLIGIGGGGAVICDDCRSLSIVRGETTRDEYTPVPDNYDGEKECGFHDPLHPPVYVCTGLFIEPITTP